MKDADRTLNNIQIVHGTKGHKLQFGLKCHELFVTLYTIDQNYFNQMYYMDILNKNTKTITKMTDTCT